MRISKIQTLQKSNTVIQRENQSISDLDLMAYYLSHGKSGDFEKTCILGKFDYELITNMHAVAGNLLFYFYFFIFSMFSPDFAIVFLTE